MPDIDPILEFISKKYYFVIMLVLSQFFQSVGLSLFYHAVLHGGKRSPKSMQMHLRIAIEREICCSNSQLLHLLI